MNAFFNRLALPWGWGIDNKESMDYRVLQTPIGNLILIGENNILQEIRFSNKPAVKLPNTWKEKPRTFAQAGREIKEYLAGNLKRFSVKIAPQLTDFQAIVLEEVKKIPYGKTRTYQEISNRIGQPKAVRAVGSVNAQNPLPLIIPCHRVIGSSGKLTGYAGGLKIKRFLLDLEGPQENLNFR